MSFLMVKLQIMQCGSVQQIMFMNYSVKQMGTNVELQLALLK